MDLVSRIQDSADGDIVIQRINDQSKEFAHVGLYKVRLFIKSGRKIRQVGGDDLVDVALLVIVV